MSTPGFNCGRAICDKGICVAGPCKGLTSCSFLTFAEPVLGPSTLFCRLALVLGAILLGLRSGSARVWLGLTRVYAKLPRVCAGLPRVRAGVASGVEGLRFNSAVLVGLCWGLLRFLNNFSLFRALWQECGCELWGSPKNSV